MIVEGGLKGMSVILRIRECFRDASRRFRRHGVCGSDTLNGFGGKWKLFASSGRIQMGLRYGLILTADFFLRSERGKSKVRWDYRVWLDTYNRSAKSFELTVSWWEGKLLRTEHAYTDPVELDEVTARFEKFVGRKLRTLKQCQDDLHADRRYIYPIYVATPEGIKEAWSEAEAENMMKVEP